MAQLRVKKYLKPVTKMSPTENSTVSLSRLAALALDAGYGRDDSGSEERLPAVLAVYAGHDDLERRLDQLAIEIEGFDDAQRHVAVEDSFVPEQKAIDIARCGATRLRQRFLGFELRR